LIRADLKLRPLLAVWAPLAATFLLLTGATPIVNASINRLPGRIHEADLAAFAVFLACIIVIHSPLFVSREIAIKLSVDRAGSRRALRFLLGAAAILSLFEIVLGLTPLGAALLGAFSDRPEVVEGAHHAFLVIWPAPLLIVVRGVYQAHQIRVDDTLFVGLGAFVRLLFVAVLGLALAPYLGLSGPMLGALCVTAGIATEEVIAMITARVRARPPEHSDIARLGVWRFALPLMFANMLGVAAVLFYVRIVGLVPADAQKSSLAGYQEVKSLQWLLTSGAMSLQSLTTAKVRKPSDARAMVRFAFLVGGGLSLIFAIGAFTPISRWVLVKLMNERAGGDVLRFARPALMVAAAMPLLQGVRFTLRGVLISRGQTATITVANLITLLLLATTIAFALLPYERNGTLNAYLVWVGLLLLEIGILAAMAFRRDGAVGPLPPPIRTPREASAG